MASISPQDLNRDKCQNDRLRHYYQTFSYRSLHQDVEILIERTDHVPKFRRRDKLRVQLDLVRHDCQNEKAKGIASRVSSTDDSPCIRIVARLSHVVDKLTLFYI